MTKKKSAPILASSEPPKFTPEQLECVLDEIAEQSETLGEMCSQALQAANPAGFQECALILVGMRSLIDRVGWLADYHGPGNVRQGDPLKWMLPPFYHDPPATEEAA